MDSKKLLAYITGSVDEELLARNSGGISHDLRDFRGRNTVTAVRRPPLEALKSH